MAIKVNLENQNRKRRIDLSKIKKVAEVTLKSLKVPDAEVNIVFFSSQKIRVLNRLYLGINKATDVLSFPAGKDSVKVKKKNEKRKEFLGDVAISSDRASKNAKLYKKSFTEEVTLYVIHGILHLVGYDDMSSGKRARMRKKENELLQKVGRFL